MAVSAALNIDVNQTIDQVIHLVTYDKKYVIEVANFTRYQLSRVGAYNDSENWPIGDISSNELSVGKFDCNSFSFGANYQIAGGSGFIQLAASWPIIGRRKINIGSINQSGNSPAQKIWDDMDDPSDKSTSNDSVRVRAFMKEEGRSIIWFYEIREK
ncbi:hypothetical protein Nos7524_4846 [Nostoc sp. PCC 7524]|uniref:hypothetical protein n=1 Tax=Nostoc sp. (strain ATCC 29411 / PCC 7524) TaxID=28072 RepID=UPI00029EDA8A|nr:hypothetical protein [Nostoc sp. PCC 7524]AFY50574.1 hypothetical protein Nos7524_4846 [Nostoc sp. PCC 7524]